MEPQEAIEIIQYASAFNSENSQLTKALEVAISALEKIQEYEAIGTVEECEDAMERRRKKNVTAICGVAGEKYECPECGSGLADMDLFAGYCKWCGQAISQKSKQY